MRRTETQKYEVDYYLPYRRPPTTYLGFEAFMLGAFSVWLTPHLSGYVEEGG